MKLYHIVRPVVTLAFKMYFRKIYHFGGDKIPQNKPILLSVNHPTGFFEPTVLACVFWNCEFHFITRGDMFKKPFYRRILEDLNMIPIFRFKDGFSNLKNNAATMEYVNQALADKQQIMIFTEGTTQTIKRLRPIQKGFARMAFGSYEQHGDLDLHVVPICLTYADPHVPRSEVYIEIGDAIPLSKYYEAHRENPNKAVNQLTQDVTKAMRPLLVHVEDDAREATSERLFKMYRNSFPEPVLPVIVPSKRRLLAQSEIANRLNALDDASFDALNQSLETYEQKLAQRQIKDVAVAQPWHANAKNTLALAIGFVPFLIGWYGHFLPCAYARKVRNERVRFLEFKGPVFAAVAMGTTLIQYILLLIAALIVNNWLLWAFLISLPFLGFYSLIYHELWQHYSACRQLKHLSEAELLALRAEREGILKTVYR